MEVPSRPLDAREPQQTLSLQGARRRMRLPKTGKCLCGFLRVKNQGPQNVSVSSSESLGTRNQGLSDNYGADVRQERRVQQK